MGEHLNIIARLTSVMAAAALLTCGLTAAPALAAGCTVNGSTAVCVGPDLSALAEHGDLTSVRISGTVDDLSVLAGLDKVTGLDLSGADATGADLAPVADMASLRWARLRAGQGLDLSPLASVAGLESLSVRFLLGNQDRTVRIGDSFTVPTFTGLDGRPAWLPRARDAAHVAQTGPATFKAVARGYQAYLEQPGQLALPAALPSLATELQIEGSYVATVQVDAVPVPATPLWNVPTLSAPRETLYVLVGGNQYTEEIKHQWLRSGVPIPGATKFSYMLTTADVGKTIAVRVTAIPGPGWEGSVVPTSATYIAPTTVLDRFTSVPMLKVTGTKRVGSTLTASVPATTPAATAVSYQWYRNNQEIKGAAKRTYTLTAADRGKRITVRAQLSRSGYLTRGTSSYMPSKTIDYGKFTVKKAPTMSGTVKRGRTLKASAGSWIGSPTKYTYRWHRNGVPISKATKSTYKVTSRDAGRVISVKVTAHKAGYISKTASSRTR